MLILWFFIITQIYSFSMCSKPFSSNCYNRVIANLLHFVRKCVGNNIKAFILIICIHITDIWDSISFCC